MKIFEADDLEEVYELAAKHFNCSIIDLKTKIIQRPKRGFFGLGRKKAIIEACFKDNCQTFEAKIHNRKHYKNKNVKIEELADKIESNNKKNKTQEITKKHPKVVDHCNYKEHKKDEIFNNFYSKKNKNDSKKIIIKKDSERIIYEIKNGLKLLFSELCYDLEESKVEFYNESTVYIEFSGNDSALLIGKEGYRYKALSYVIFNWINEKYGLMLRLEVAQFLKNQEESINTYLNPVIEAIKEKGSYKTKSLDGILVHIALKRLREEFPDKYVAVKTNSKGEKYVLVNKYKDN